jgi:hypothetical protein
MSLIGPRWWDQIKTFIAKHTCTRNMDVLEMEFNCFVHELKKTNLNLVIERPNQKYP